MHRPASLFLCFLLAACGGADDSAPRALPGDGASRVAGPEAGAAAAPTIPAGSPVVVFLGDSLAAGLHLPADQAFPAVAQRELAAAGLPFELVNAGVSGDTTAGGLRRIDWVLARKPAVVVVELGGNDGLRGQDLASVETNLRAIVARAKAAGARVLLLGIDVPTSLGPDYSRDFAALYERVAAAESVPLVPHFLAGVGGVARLTLEDGLHPTPEGHRLLAQNLLPALRTELEALVSR
jgi:acyl-CoA thioesterase-1